MIFDIPSIITEQPDLSKLQKKYNNNIHGKVAYKITKVAWLRTKAAEAQNWRCCWCGVKTVAESGFSNSATLEHVIPRGKGGDHTPDNTVMACSFCNNRRSDISVEDYIPIANKKVKIRIHNKAIKLSNNNWYSSKGFKIDIEEWITSISADNETKTYLRNLYLTTT